jgi:DNA-binding FadR family transcriptional regulator
VNSTQRVLADLRKLLDSGQIAPGSRLPPERELCVQLRISRTVLRDALSTLEAEGRIWRHVGKGTFAGGRPVSSSRDLVLLSGITSPTEVMEVRLILEPHAAAQAALRANQTDIDLLRNCLRKLESASNHSNYARWDSTFHRTIASAAHNSLLLALFDGVNAVRNQAAWGSVWQSAIGARSITVAQQHHETLVRAIAGRKANEAFLVMRNHIASVQQWVFGAADPQDLYAAGR